MSSDYVVSSIALVAVAALLIWWGFHTNARHRRNVSALFSKGELPPSQTFRGHLFYSFEDAYRDFRGERFELGLFPTERKVRLYLFKKSTSLELEASDIRDVRVDRLWVIVEVNGPLQYFVLRSGHAPSLRKVLLSAMHTS